MSSVNILTAVCIHCMVSLVSPSMCPHMFSLLGDKFREGECLQKKPSNIKVSNILRGKVPTSLIKCKSKKKHVKPQRTKCVSCAQTCAEYASGQRPFFF